MNAKREFRGSRKHILDWTGRPEFLSELEEMLSGIPVSFDADTRVLPKGHDYPDEAKLDGFGPTWLQEHSAWGALREWWLVHTHGANTPNWDLLVTCSLDGNPGLILVEAKANWPELSRQGKPLSQDASPKSHENHKQIGAAIDEARAEWQEIDPDVQISRDSHYQLSNRLAFTWKLASLGIPTVLVYLGFTGDEGIRDVGDPFLDADDWYKAMRDYTKGVFPGHLLEKRLDVRGTPMWVLLRSWPVLEVSQLRKTSSAV